MNLNKVFVLGRVTRDPELKALENGRKVVSFSIATNKVWRDKNGENQEIVEFHNVVFWEKPAEVIAQYVRKGYLLLVEGRLQTRSWEDNDGKKQYRTEIVGEQFQLPPKSMSSGENKSGSDFDSREKDIDLDEVFPDDENQTSSKTTGTKKKIGVTKPSKNKSSVDYPDNDINPEDIPF